MQSTPEAHEAAIRLARANSNRAIQRRNLLGVGASLDEDLIVIIGDGTFVPSRAAYLKLFKQQFDSKQGMSYERIPDLIQISTSDPIAAEQGHWIATLANGSVAFTGTYSAMWRVGPEGWKIRSEQYVTLTAKQ